MPLPAPPHWLLRMLRPPAPWALWACVRGVDEASWLPVAPVGPAPMTLKRHSALVPAKLLLPAWNDAFREGELTALASDATDALLSNLRRLNSKLRSARCIAAERERIGEVGDLSPLKPSSSSASERRRPAGAACMLRLSSSRASERRRGGGDNASKLSSSSAPERARLRCGISANSPKLSSSSACERARPRGISLLAKSWSAPRPAASSGASG
mmetsp:Transcript_58780/g.126324  ORF Transcript_58780/g.126324 Transcript_58780/m.126324 type:complete len:214 (-) Transcript_58780:150-791(-)